MVVVDDWYEQCFLTYIFLNYFVFVFYFEYCSFYCINNVTLTYAGMGSSNWLERPWAWRRATDQPEEDLIRLQRIYNF